MTTFDLRESSTEDSKPVELYEFILGSTSYRFTSAEDDVVIGSDTYLTSAIGRSRLEQGSDQNNRTLTVTMPASFSLPQLYVGVPPGQQATINIYRYQRNEVPSFGTQILLFKGQVQTCRFPNDGHSAEFACRSIESALNRNIPRFSFMGMCNHILYDSNCGVLEADFDYIGNADLVDENQVTINGLAASGIDFTGGYVRPTGTVDFRMVLSQSGDVLTLLLPFAEDPTGSNLQAFAGCDHVLTGDCALIFDNVENFGGYAFVPNKNIFQTGL